MQLLPAALGARRAIEIGTFTGLLGAVRRPRAARRRLAALPGRATRSGRRSPGGTGTRAGLADRIELRLGDAHESLRALPAEPTFDLAFVDADKTGYADYVEQLYPRMRPNGVVLLDNTLRAGRVLDPQTDDDRAVVALNAGLAADPRWETVLLPLADGLTMLPGAMSERASFAVRVSRPRSAAGRWSCWPTTPVTSCRCSSARWASPAPTRWPPPFVLVVDSRLYFVVLRHGPGGMVRALISDATMLEWVLAAEVVERYGIGVDTEGAFDDDESGWPGGDLDVFADDGLPHDELRRDRDRRRPVGRRDGAPDRRAARIRRRADRGGDARDASRRSCSTSAGCSPRAR